jgi:hypothetical protein
MNEEPEARSVLMVVIEILNVVPDDRTELRNALVEFITKDLAYRAPETLSDVRVWVKFTEIMKNHLPTATEPWEMKCFDIFNGK